VRSEKAAGIAKGTGVKLERKGEAMVEFLTGPSAHVVVKAFELKGENGGKESESRGLDGILTRVADTARVLIVALEDIGLEISLERLFEGVKVANDELQIRESFGTRVTGLAIHAFDV